MSQAHPRRGAMMYVQMLKYQCGVVFSVRSFAHNGILRLLIISNEAREQAIRLTCVSAFCSDRDYGVKTCVSLAAA